MGEAGGGERGGNGWIDNIDIDMLLFNPEGTITIEYFFFVPRLLLTVCYHISIRDDVTSYEALFL